MYSGIGALFFDTRLTRQIVPHRLEGSQSSKKGVIHDFARMSDFAISRTLQYIGNKTTRKYVKSMIPIIIDFWILPFIYLIWYIGLVL